MYGLYKGVVDAHREDYYVILGERLGIYVYPRSPPSNSAFGFKIVYWGYVKVKEWEETP